MLSRKAKGGSGHWFGVWEHVLPEHQVVFLVMYSTQGPQTLPGLRGPVWHFTRVGNVGGCVVPSFPWPAYWQCWPSNVVFMRECC